MTKRFMFCAPGTRSIARMGMTALWQSRPLRPPAASAAPRSAPPRERALGQLLGHRQRKQHRIDIRAALDREAAGLQQPTHMAGGIAPPRVNLAVVPAQ